MSGRFTGLAALVLSTSWASAAPVPEGPGADDTVSAPAACLLLHRQVQKELKLAPEQRLLIIDGLQDIDEVHEKKFDALLRQPNVADQAIEALEREHTKNREKLLTDFAVKELTAAKRTRLRQINWHVRGVDALKDSRVVKALQLTEEQKTALNELGEQVKAKTEDYLDAQGGDGEEKAKKEIVKVRAEALAKADEVLTPEQRAAWKAMRGEPLTGFNADDFWLKLLLGFDELTMP